MAVGCDRHERRGRPGGVLVGQRAQRDEDRGRDAGPGQQAQQTGPGAAAQPDAVQPDERQQRAGRVPRDVGDPRIRLVIQDSAGERPQRLGDVGDGGHLAQVFVAGGQPAREATLPAIDHRQGERPRAGHGPRHHGQPPPGHPLRDRRPPQHRGGADRDRRHGARADVGVPPPEDRRGGREGAEPFGVGVEQRGDDVEVQVRDDECGDDENDGGADRDRLSATDGHDCHPIAGRQDPTAPARNDSVTTAGFGDDCISREPCACSPRRGTW